MNYYQEINLLPDAEISLSFIWQNIFQQVHIALVEHKVSAKQSAIAVGFPDYGDKKFPLGSRLRLFAKEQVHLEKLSIHKWLDRLTEYSHVKTIKTVPDDVSWVSFSREHVKSPARIERDMLEKAKRWSKKSGRSVEECLSDLKINKPKSRSLLPFIFLYSQETKRRSPEQSSQFPLFIQKQEVSSSLDGFFDCYGFSSKSNRPGIIGCVPQF